MVSRERLLRVAGKAADVATTRRVRVAAQVLLVAALAFALVRLRSIWQDSHVDLARIDWGVLAAATALVAISVLAAACVWLDILRCLGTKPRARWTAIYTEAQLGKYIPGSVWQYAGRATLARGEGVAVRVATMSVTVELIGSVVAAAAIASLAGGLPAIAPTTSAVILAAAAWAMVSRRATIDPQPLLRLSRSAVRATVRTIGLYLPIWAVLGVAFWLTARALFDVSVADVAFYCGVFALAWLVGLVAVFAPGGLGVREAMLVALLRSRISTGDALLLAGVSRGVLTIVDIGAGALGAAVLRRAAKRRVNEAPPGSEDQSARWANTTNPVP